MDGLRRSVRFLITVHFIRIRLPLRVYKSPSPEYKSFHPLFCINRKLIPKKQESSVVDDS